MEAVTTAGPQGPFGMVTVRIVDRIGGCDVVGQGVDRNPVTALAQARSAFDSKAKKIRPGL